MKAHNLVVILLCRSACAYACVHVCVKECEFGEMKVGERTGERRRKKKEGKCPCERPRGAHHMQCDHDSRATRRGILLLHSNDPNSIKCRSAKGVYPRGLCPESTSRLLFSPELRAAYTRPPHRGGGLLAGRNVTKLVPSGMIPDLRPVWG